MKKAILAGLVAAIFSSIILPARAQSYPAVMQLAVRRVPWLAPHLSFHAIARENGHDVFEISSNRDHANKGDHSSGRHPSGGNAITISASGANAAAEGLNWYLKYYCHRSLSHMGDNVGAVSPLPVVKEPVRVAASAPLRYALNYCTYNYTMSFYNWEQWEKELDWMALNGVNAMLVANGEEAVWQNTLRRMGYGEKEIGEFITGPAFNAWWLMGNIQGWGGPMPQSQIDGRRELVKKMIRRMHSLGIEPVMPGFYGMVPSTLKDKTTAHIITQGKWGAFGRPDILDPTDTAFSRVAGIFYEETAKLYGRDIHYFSGDPFHEGGITDGVDLEKAGVNIQEAMQRYFPGSVWVLQGWQANPHKEMLAGLDKSKVLIQELFGENTHNWETRNGYEGTPFVWCTVTNFGERPGISGKLQRFADETYRAGHGAFAAYMKGVGIMPEGINNNPVVYDLMLELGWHKDKLNVGDWIPHYILARYGKEDADISGAWKLLLQTVYSSNLGYSEGPAENILCARPALEIKSVSTWGTIRKTYDEHLFSEAVKLFARAAPRFGNSETYRIDLINFTRQTLSNVADTVFHRLVEAWRQKDQGVFKVQAGHFLELCDRMEDLLNTDSYYRLNTYKEMALRNGRTPAEKSNNLHNALMLVTFWGANDRKEDDLHEYAYKEWAGMMKSFYGKRWEMYFDWLDGQLKGEPAKAPDFFEWERHWVTQNQKILPDPAPKALIPLVNGLLKWSNALLSEKEE